MNTIENPPIIRGRSAMFVLDSQNREQEHRVLFSGRKNPHTILVPDDIYWNKGEDRYPDSDTSVVCATDDAAIAVFMAIMPSDRTRFGYQGNTDCGSNFYIDAQRMDEFTTGTGYVAIVDDDAFEYIESPPIPENWPGTVIRRLPEYRSKALTVVKFNVQVGYEDFNELLNTQPQSSLQEY
jgi:hypothetical protein